MTTSIARQAHRSLETLHAMIYFAPEAEERFQRLGLEPGRMAYFAGRSAPLGAVGPGTVTATFYNFNPEVVAPVIPRAWSITSPTDVVAARFDAADTALRRLLGDDGVSSDAVAESAELAREATTALSPEGRALYAAHADLDWPEAPHVVLWHALSLLREFRGDGHIIALQQAGLSGLEALLIQIGAGQGLSEKFTRQTRGWSDEQWASAQQSLRERGLLNEDNGLTAEGEALREEVESRTDALDMAAWKNFDPSKAERLLTHGAALSKQAVKAGAFPREAFAH